MFQAESKDAGPIKRGIPPGMVRLSVGQETLEDLLWDLDRVLEGV